MTHAELCFASAVEIATLVREKKIAPIEVTETFLARIDKSNRKINAYVTVTPELARAAAKRAEAAVTGNPAASVPCGWTTNGLPGWPTSHRSALCRRAGAAGKRGV